MKSTSMLNVYSSKGIKMKFEIKITDASLEDVKRLTSALSGNMVPPTPTGLVEEIKVTESPVLHKQEIERVERETTKEEPIEEKPELLKEVTSETDAEGLPWDERIHSSNKKLKSDGSWWRKKGISEDYYDEIKAEILGNVQTEMQQTPAVSTGDSFIPPVAVTPEPVQTQTTQSAQNTFNSILIRVQQAMVTGNADMQYIPNLVQRINQRANVSMNAITDMVGNQKIIDIASEVLSEDGN